MGLGSASVAVWVVLACVASAEAATAGMEGSTLVYQAGPGERNFPLVGRVGGASPGTIVRDYVARSEFVSTGDNPEPEEVPVTPGPGCTRHRGVFTDQLVAVKCGVAKTWRIETGDMADEPAGFLGSARVRVNLGSGNDKFFSAGSGTGGDDVVDAGPGDDLIGSVDRQDPVEATIYGRDGNDQIAGLGRAFGGPGSDVLYAFEGRADGGSGNDRLQTIRKAATLYGGTGRDQIAGNYVSDGGPGGDFLQEALPALRRPPTLKGGDGPDVLVSSRKGSVLSGGTGG